MSDNVIRIGVIGAGANTRDRHIPGLLEQEDIEMVAVANRSPASSRKVADRFGFARIAGDWTEIINADDIDAVVIGTWPYMHCTATVAALKAGKHVMCEARMAMNASEAHRMHRTAQALPTLVAQIVPSPMTLGVDRTIQRMVREGYLGEPLAVNMHAGDTWLDLDGPLHWRHDMDRSGLNIMTMGIWYEALIRWLGEASTVLASGGTFVKQRFDEESGVHRSVRIPEHIDVSGQLACGAQYHLQVSSVTGLSGPPSCSLYGSQGTLRFTEGQLLGGRRGDSELSVISIPDDERGVWRVEEEFVNAIRGLEEITHTDFTTAVKYMEFTEAVSLSLQSRETTALPLL